MNTNSGPSDPCAAGTLLTDSRDLPKGEYTNMPAPGEAGPFKPSTTSMPALFVALAVLTSVFWWSASALVIGSRLNSHWPIGLGFAVVLSLGLLVAHCSLAGRHTGGRGVVAVFQCGTVIVTAHMPAVIASIEDALQSLSARVRERDTIAHLSRIVAITHVGPLSFGETIRISITELNSGRVVASVCSYPRWPLTLIDYGNSVRNVTRILDASSAVGRLSSRAGIE